MFYRRKIILSLLQLFDGELDKIRLQKLLFLFSQRKVKPEYDFIPYRFGCFSYSADADMTAMASKGLLEEDDKHFRKLDEVDYRRQLKPADLQLLEHVKLDYGSMSANALMKHTYMNYSFYAIRSTVAGSILSEEELVKVNNAQPKQTDTVLFTIGYEGISLEEYLVRLLKNDVRLLVDVRSNPLSMKYGFSKSQLKKYCESVGIVYLHIPEVGIASEQRQALNTQKDYDDLFAIYRKSNLSKTLTSQLGILDLLVKHERIALTCFEANICQCHRKHLAEAIENLPAFDYEVKHI